MIPCFSKLHESFGENIKTELNQSNYATKNKLQNARGVATSNLAAISDLACFFAFFLKKVYKVDVEKLKSSLVDLRKLINVVKMMLFKRQFMMNWLKNNTIQTDDTSDLA